MFIVRGRYLLGEQGGVLSVLHDCVSLSVRHDRVQGGLMVRIDGEDWSRGGFAFVETELVNADGILCSALHTIRARPLLLSHLDPTSNPQVASSK